MKKYSFVVFKSSLLALAISGCSGGGGGGTPASGSGSGSGSGSTVNLTFPEIVKANKAWNIGVTGTGISIAVIDTGVRSTHEAFTSGRVRTDLGRNSATATSDSSDPLINGGHGTEVTGIIAGTKASKIGVAPNAEIIPIRTCDANCGSGQTLTTWGNAFAWAIAQGAKVINSSNFIPYDASGASDPLHDQLVNAGTSNIVVVHAAGNNGSGTGPVQPAREVDSALYSGNMIAVGAVTVNLETGVVFGLTSTSNDAGAAKAKFMVAPGQLVKTSANTGDTDYTYKTGTSYAAPFVAGAAALIREAYPALTAAQVVQALLNSADDLGAVGIDTTYGHGMLNIEAALTLAATY